ncbi:MAG: cytochrome b/b6 domain-containing protein [Pseudomonadota bacterium]
MLLNTRERYGLVAQILHWITAGLILFLLPLGVYMTDLPQATAADVSYKASVFSLHKSLGVIVFFVALARVLWALIQPHPRPLNSERKLESLAAQTIHWMLYGAIILMPFTGWLTHSASAGFAPLWGALPQDLPFVPKDPSLATLFGIAHVFTAVLLTAAVGLHVAGALKHTIIDRDGTLNRMIPGQLIPGLRPLSEAPLPKAPLRGLAAFLALCAFAVLGFAVTADYTWEVGQRGAQQAATPAAEAGTQTETASDTSAATQPEAQPEAQTSAATDSPTGDGSTWIVDPENSTLGLQIVQMGNPVVGEFESWTAAITFDPDDLESASVTVDVDVSSIVLGGVGDQAKGENFLNTAAFPVARFTSQSFAETAPDNYVAAGELSLVGQTHPLTLPFSLKIENGRAVMAGEVTIERLAYGIGAKGFSSDTQLGYGVLIQVSLEAQEAGS